MKIILRMMEKYTSESFMSPVRSFFIAMRVGHIFRTCNVSTRSVVAVAASSSAGLQVHAICPSIESLISRAKGQKLNSPGIS